MMMLSLLLFPPMWFGSGWMGGVLYISVSSLLATIYVCYYRQTALSYRQHAMAALVLRFGRTKY